MMLLFSSASTGRAECDLRGHSKGPGHSEASQHRTAETAWPTPLPADWGGDLQGTR